MSRSLFLRRFAPEAHRSPAPVIVNPIASIYNQIRMPRPFGWEELDSEIRLIPPASAAMLSGLEAYSHLIVVFWLDKLGQDRPRPTQIQPGGNQAPIQGVLSTRSQLRPNPIGVSVVPLLDIRGDRLRVRGLDAIDGTPVLDIKPYIPHYDSVPAARVPGWILAQEMSDAH
ncbi:MAG: tRNA (N6-threonylcarbamoyladenosine(37)-N6)-methyltransferase TrmO [Dehalococcoidia bacterium]